MNMQPLRVSVIREALAEAGAGSPALTIGVVDGLPDFDHPLLRSASLQLMNAMVPPDAGGLDPHATAICSLLFGAEEPVRGLVPECKGLILPIFFPQKNGLLRPASQLDLARAISFALERGVSIINISAGQKSVTTETETHLDGTLRQAADAGVLIVAAAGNDGCACIHLPAGVETTLSVGALDATGRPLEASNWAEIYRRNGLLAPGEDLPIAKPGGGVGSGTGTSYATAIVSGVAALLLSVAQRERYDLGPRDIRDILIDSATPCDLPGDGACDRYLAGTLDAAAALALLHRTGRSAQPPAHREIRLTAPEIEQSAN